MSALACTGCGTALKPNARRKGTRCHACLARGLANDPEARAKATATLRAGRLAQGLGPRPFPCAGCGTELLRRPRRKTDLCRSCLARRNNLDPQLLKRRNRAVSQAIRSKAANDPAYLERKREAGRRLGTSGASHRLNPPGSEARQRAAASISRTRRAGIPAPYWDEYQRLVHKQRYTADEARRIVLEQQDKDRRQGLSLGEIRERQAGVSEAAAAISGSYRLGLAFARAAKGPSA